MPVIKVDDQEVEVKEGENLLQALLSKGFDLPYFCWHPAMGSVGACRQCAVVQYANDDDERGRIVMGCMTPVSEGARFSLKTDNAVQFRDSVIENLMLNHPHDCPVCEEGGECHLQDMTVMVGHWDRKYEGKKTTYRNQYLGPFIGHEMNRCITCYRCVRYYQDYSGGHDLAAFGSRDRVFFGRMEPGILENEFAGNLVEVCPTGVFTDKTLSKRYTRKWDLQSAPTVCTGCSLGCNTSTSERYGELRRVHNRYHHEINGYFLCDRGRFGAQFVNSNQRIHQAGTRNNHGLYDAKQLDTAIDVARSMISGSKSVKGIGSPRASLEANQALIDLVGEDNFSDGMSANDRNLHRMILQAMANGLRVPALSETEHCDAVIVLGEDVTNFAPRLALALRQATRQKALALAEGAKIPLWHDAAVREIGQSDRSPLIIVTPTADRLDEVASHPVRLMPDAISTFGQDITKALQTGNFEGKAGQIAELLKSAKRPLIVCGTGLQHEGILESAVDLASTLSDHNPNTGFFPCASEANSIGSSLLGIDRTIDELLESKPETLVVVENDLALRLGHRFSEVLEGIKYLIVLDHMDNATVSASSVVLPAATFAESQGTWVNNEGRAQRGFAVFHPEGAITPAYQILDALRGKTRRASEIRDALAAARPLYQGIVEAAPSEKFRIEGARVSRMTHRASGRTAMHAHISVHEPMPAADEDSPLVFSMEGNAIDAPDNLRGYSWSPGWNSNQSNHKFQAEVGGEAKSGDPGVRLVTSNTAVPGKPVTDPASSFAASRQLVPIHHIFGSDELTARAAELSQLSPKPYLRMHPDTATEAGLKDGQGLGIEVAGQILRFAVIQDELFEPGHIGYPVMAATALLNDLLNVTLTPVPDWTPVTDPLTPNIITTDRTR